MSDSHKKKSAEFAALQLEGLPRFAARSEASSSTKSIYFVRHGEAEHNVAPRPWGPELVDAPLTAIGREQAASSLEALTRALDGTLELILVSPLTRALETALIGFKCFADRADFPFVAIEACRERFGVNLPDKRRSTAAVKGAFARVDFSQIEAADDDLFADDERESAEALSRRADAFLAMLHARPEKHIAVVCHSSFLCALTNAALQTEAAPGMGEWFANAELRLVHLQKLEGDGAS